MADNVTVTAGVGTTIAADDVGSVYYQRVKLDVGADGASAAVLAGVGPAANALRVAPANDITDTTYIGDIKFGEALPTGTNTIGATKDAGCNWTPSYLHTASADASGGTDVTAAPTSGQKIVIDDIICSTDTALKMTFECETTGTDVIVLYLPVNGSAQITPRGQIKLATADKKLRAITSAAGNVAITVCYHSEA